MRTDIGVIVGRFQAPYLHAGHRYLINSALARKNKILVLVGCSPLPLKVRNPLDFETRAMMINREFPDVIVARLNDCRTDELWSERLDGVVESYFPSRPAVLYGSRDSFIDHYHGKHTCELIEPLVSTNGDLSASHLREQIGPLGSRDFRAGVIYASRAPFPTSYQAVDVAVINTSTNMVLLGHKLGDGDKHRFVGGFVDPQDASLERAAKREVLEETSMLETADYKYLGSVRINDWRYRGSRDQVMSAFFVAKYVYGRPAASDDLDQVAWFTLDKVEELVITEHEPLAKLLIQSRKNSEVKNNVTA